MAAVVLVALCVTALCYAIATNPLLQWGTVWRYMFSPIIVSGLLTTLALTVIVMLLAVFMGTVAALMMLSPSKLLAAPAVAFVWFFRGAPALVQIILWYNLALIFPRLGIWLPMLGEVVSVPTNEVMTPFVAAVVALSLHEAGYMAEIVRGGLKTVSKGQTEAALSLGMHPSSLIFRIILPQAMRMIIPPTGNETINLLKTTSLVSIIAVADLLYSAQAIYARTFETIPLLLVVTAWYLAVVSVMTVGQFYLERFFSREEGKPAGGVRQKVFGMLIPMRRRFQ
ncbi:amino acid ABC transporter permease [Devosia yakushimensis]|uniref:Amino acid ABC transporter permease n=1 Tax=Devosia yakushimensis TaxID=470028 RepID=A0ABQ5UJ84_9HYPH|nr:amino acid ABC transporter permease [Devosia yakushimensis]GLQ12097.1 amino acid ABC transporter permease [Devosia yakushimensis]